MPVINRPMLGLFREGFERRPLIRRFTKDRIETMDLTSGCRIVTERNRLTGEVRTTIIGKCDESTKALHADAVKSKWSRPFLGRI